ncbi:MAG: hypothetical protein JOZ96_16540 [Acidobacteria bacterium]|nr:hypothetical protein [Acidobacteriota bacterium]
MKDLVLLILKRIPQYFSDFVSCLSAPKAFVRARNGDDQQALAEAMIFLGISFAISMILYWPLIPTQVESARYLAGRALLNLILVAAATGATLLGWRCVGGKAQFGRYFIITCYYWGVVLVCMTLILVCAFGVVKILDPEIYPIIVDASTRVQFSNPKLNEIFSGPDGTRHMTVSFIFSLFIVVFLPVAVTAWSILGWGAYREINGLTKRQSFAAAMLASLFSFGLAIFSTLFQSVMD